MVQKMYEVTVEAVVQRTVCVEAKNIDEAERLGCKEVEAIVGATSTEAFEIRRVDDE